MTFQNVNDMAARIAREGVFISRKPLWQRIAFGDLMNLRGEKLAFVVVVFQHMGKTFFESMPRPNPGVHELTLSAPDVLYRLSSRKDKGKRDYS